jgi:hypothetical protein
MRSINHQLLDMINDSITVSKKPLHLLNIDKFFDFLNSLESLQLISKNNILNVFADLFECASESSLASLFDMMERRFISDSFLNSNSEKDI